VNRCQVSVGSESSLCDGGGGFTSGPSDVWGHAGGFRMRVEREREEVNQRGVLRTKGRLQQRFQRAERRGRERETVSYACPEAREAG